MSDGPVYVVQMSCTKSGPRAYARSALSETTEEFGSADALWRFLTTELAAPQANAAGIPPIPAPRRSPR